MESIRGMINYFLNIEFYETALLMTQYLLKKENNIDENYCILFKCLGYCNHIGVLNEFIHNKPHLLKYKDVRLICAKLGINVQNLITNTTIYENISTNYKIIFEINFESILTFIYGINLNDKLRFDSFIKAFELDSNNTEVLIYMFKDGIITYNELMNNILKIKNECLKTIFQEIFSSSENTKKLNIILINPLVDIYLKLFIKNNNLEELFKESVLLLDFFEDCNYLNFIIGIYYIYKKQYNEAKKILYKVIKKNVHFGFGYMYLGICCGYLREIDNAIKFLDKSYLICNNNPLPAHYLAYQYQELNNFNKAKYYHKLSINQNSIFNEHYAHFLIKNNHNVEALHYIKPGSLFMGYYYLYTNVIKKSKEIIDQITEYNVDYWLLKGYLSHINNNFDEAITYYQNSINCGQSLLAETMRNYAIENKYNQIKITSKLVPYAHILFDNLLYKNKKLFIFL